MKKLATYTYANEENNAVEISRTSKGDITFSVKVFNEKVKQAEKQAIEIFEDLTNHFYPPKGGEIAGRVQGCSTQPDTQSE